MATLPRTEVIRLEGLDVERLFIDLDPLPPGFPVVIRCGIYSAPSTAVVVSDLLGQLEAVGKQLFPAWLPDGDLIKTATGLDRRVVRLLARRHAAHSEHFGPFLADVAEAALLGQTRRERFAPEIRARGLARILAEAYRCDGAALLIDGAATLTENEEKTAAAALSWLAHHGIGVWLADGALASVDRFPAVVVGDYTGVHTFVEPAASPPELSVGLSDIPAPTGQPHPLSDAEQQLARVLASCDWAAGHRWNQRYYGNPLMPTIVVDLIWPDERCIVEIDGPDHRGAPKYAADRRRDNALALDGFRVLRFTNEQILDEMAMALETIEAMLFKLRLQEGISL